MHRQFIFQILLVILLFLIGEDLIASPQMPDYLIYKGDTFSVYNLILEKYFEKIKQTDQGSLFGLKFRDGSSFNCWRGYQAIYKIENDSLFLSKIISCGERFNHKSIDSVESGKRINDIFKDKVISNKVFIDWYSGNISLPNGKLLRWDGVFYKTFENEILINIDNGVVKKVNKTQNYIDSPDRINRRYNDTISNVIYEKLRSLDWKKLNECECDDSYIVTINKNGKISDVNKSDCQTKNDWKDLDKEDRKNYNYCIKSIRRALRSLKFDIIKQNGVKVSEKVYIEIWYEESTGKLENWTR